MSDRQARQCFARQSSFADLMADLDPDQQVICAGVRQKLLELSVPLNEVIWHQQRLVTYGLIVDEYAATATDNFMYICIEKEVQLGFYYASELAYAAEILNARGRLVINNIDVLQSAAVTALLMAALEQRSIC
ncbi:hypothetical protein [Aliamphritea ceti]|uniref:hypothetical protein n=1 Tax=Aliamphritea ceti TaxID=1524258 RepID=UPI0021C38BB8|nr:hypothetical protein [Aliamphritea ceti]